MSTPIETVWPVGVVLILWCVGLFRLRAEVQIPRLGWLLFLIAVGVRLWWIPAWDGHVFDGHEAEYWDLFRGERSPSRGGTVMVPAMQWFWWLLGHIAPPSERFVVVLMSVFGAASIGLSAGAMGRLGGRSAGWITATLLVLHSGHAAWSSSAYNVILPHFFSSMALFGVATASRRREGPGAWAWMVAASLVLAVSLRMDSGTVAVGVVALVLAVRPDGASVLDRLKQWLIPGLVCVGVAGLCVWPMLWPGSLPGAGERMLSFGLNVDYLRPYHPFDGLAPLALLAAVSVVSFRRHPGATGALLFWLISHHLLLATFDDMAERHALVVAPAIAGLAALGLSSVGAVGIVGVVLFAILEAADFQETASRYYGSEADYSAVLDRAPYDQLPRVEWTGQPPADCGWVAEDHRVAAPVVASHFNLLNPDEEASLRGSDGCLKWCVDVQDWRWSSRGVRDRALRLGHIFKLNPSAVVVDSITGYACVTMDVGHRARTESRSTDGNDGSTSHNDHPVP
jgi:hypothetical protein